MEYVEYLTIAVAAAALIIAVTALAPRAGVASPLVLVVLGAGVSLLPWVPAIEVPPELILGGVLPPLLYSAAVGLPSMDFRRDFTAIGGLSVTLVVISSVLLGLLFRWLIPDIDLATAIALGAIVSPTDAVATTIVKRLGASPRSVTMLEGESLLNDASALVLLRSAIAATAASVSLWEVVGSFVYAAGVAVVVGVPVGWVGLRIRKRLQHAALSTAMSFVVPFLAYLPAEELGASGLVAVVAAGLVTGNGSARHLRPQDRIAERSNWHTVELLLEGAVFLAMGIQLFDLIEDAEHGSGSVLQAAGVAAVAGAAVLVVRAAFVTPLIGIQARRARRGQAVRETLTGFQDRIDLRVAATPPATAESTEHTGRHSTTARLRRIQGTLRRRTADIDYVLAKPLGWREGTLLVWAGMRGVVTLAAAQTLPAETPGRSFLVLVAFGVAFGTLLVQGSTLPWVTRRLGLVGQDTTGDLPALRRETEQAARAFLADPRRPDGTPYDDGVVARVRKDMFREHESQDEDAVLSTERFVQYRELRLATIAAQREELLAARSAGTYDSAQLGNALDLLDAEQIAVEMRKGKIPIGEDEPER
ncbi:cation:proton antiporter [Promicromonospora iranensis]|uniref:CPA1 family monovalent cation:H+ antiporter n=1 Tax=Promicromonospora iranensis TaxID=1105144 RepID=A0ABU2CVM8_9MICO|nr:sodium:proton antiporter [Promicromonospora iranensis]MDR7385336.1 CPA1 family monovalent cation:H+ antiporter [Promicromonospora iranensis]